jgi:hypothetical protein
MFSQTMDECLHAVAADLQFFGYEFITGRRLFGWCGGFPADRYLLVNRLARAFLKLLIARTERRPGYSVCQTTVMPHVYR